jgi:hypothetical protein
MKNIADIGTLVRVTPQDKIWIRFSPEKNEYIDDKTPFIMTVDGLLEDGHMFYGVFGKVSEGPERYLGLICSLITRLDGDDWRQKNRSQANFKVGRESAVRNHLFDLKHPEGTEIADYPVIDRYGRIEVIE